jgi:hypothetical protein
MPVEVRVLSSAPPFSFRSARDSRSNLGLYLHGLALSLYLPERSERWSNLGLFLHGLALSRARGGGLIRGCIWNLVRILALILGLR